MKTRCTSTTKKIRVSKKPKKQKKMKEAKILVFYGEEQSMLILEKVKFSTINYQHCGFYHYNLILDQYLACLHTTMVSCVRRYLVYCVSFNIIWMVLFYLSFSIFFSYTIIEDSTTIILCSV